ncbi:MAG: CDP-glycerol glycerophosphotransferase family protein [Myxococcales bacterium]|nr:CDP-glycerol glycerophosphotransferase family protein [Myxococcales bacterium]
MFQIGADRFELIGCADQRPLEPRFELQAVSERGTWNLLIKPHDHAKNAIDWFKELARYENGVVRLVRDLDVVPYLHAADLLVTDASSVAVEYTLLDRPIIFMDVPQMFNKVRKRSPSLDLDTYGRKIGEIMSAKSLLNSPTCAAVTVLEVRSVTVPGVWAAAVAALALGLVRGPEMIPVALQPVLSMPAKLPAICSPVRVALKVPLCVPKRSPKAKNRIRNGPLLAPVPTTVPSKSPMMTSPGWSGAPPRLRNVRSPWYVLLGCGPTSNLAVKGINSSIVGSKGQLNSCIVPETE